MTNFLNLGLTGYTANSNAFASGHLRLTQSGSDLLVQVDRDGGGATNSFVTVFAISNGYTGGFTAFNFDGFIGNLTLTGIGALDETITGATGNDVLSGGGRQRRPDRPGRDRHARRRQRQRHAERRHGQRHPDTAAPATTR